MYRPKDIQERILHRFKIARGHLNKVVNMIEEDEYCIDIIMQSQAVQKALKTADDLILETHLRTCATNAIKKGNQDKAISEIMNVFKRKPLWLLIK